MNIEKIREAFETLRQYIAISIDLSAAKKKYTLKMKTVG